MKVHRNEPYTFLQKMGWWAKVLTIASLLSGFSLYVGKWIYTRASTDEVAKKLDVQDYKEEHGKLERKVDQTQNTVGNVRDNLLLLMGAQKIVPVPMPKEGN